MSNDKACAENLEKQAEEILKEMMDKNPAKLLTIFQYVIAVQMEKAKAAKLELACELNIDDKRYKIETSSMLIDIDLG